MKGDATDLAAAIRHGKLSAAEAMQASLEADVLQEPLGAIAYLDAAMGLASADDRDSERRSEPDRFAARPFGGVPTLAKDLGGPFAGLPVTAGSGLFERKGGEADSDLAARFREAGFCLFGLTTSPEFGLSLASEPAIGPVCRNPLDPTRTAGGSSGGAAAAVAAGIVAIAHATDAGGSIRVPAACCGLVGMKPTRGAIPGGPSFGNHLAGIASELAVCRSVRDTAVILDWLSGNSRGPFADPSPLHIGNGCLRIGLLTDTGAAYPTEGDRLAAVEDAARALENDGHVIVPLSWAEFEWSVAASGRAFADIVSVNLAALMKAAALDESRAEPLTQAFTARGRALPATSLWNTLNDAVLVSHKLWTLFDRVDCILMPMLSSVPLAIGSFPSDHADTDLHLGRVTAFAPLACLANISGFPALTLPFGRDEHAMPLPVQIMAPMGHEPRLLSLAARLEAEGRWQHRFPVAGLPS
ncbi:amidase (plasmid) [Rhizobium beringeri]|uniref:amidase n=1 Tax=Rhizobium TaxID=379 RepID=UPI001C9857BE|nr:MULTISPECIES: amidase [Rhizobium]MBY5455801.1 amidase [Rhizobium leguminosarum]WSH54557.1 amidase [Rhizobium beringeri]